MVPLKILKVPRKRILRLSANKIQKYKIQKIELEVIRLLYWEIIKNSTSEIFHLVVLHRIVVWFGTPPMKKEGKAEEEEP